MLHVCSALLWGVHTEVCRTGQAMSHGDPSFSASQHQASITNPSNPNTWRLCFYFKCRYLGSNLGPCVASKLRPLELSISQQLFLKQVLTIWSTLILSIPAVYLVTINAVHAPLPHLSQHSLWPHYFYKCITQIVLFYPHN